MCSVSTLARPSWRLYGHAGHVVDGHLDSLTGRWGWWRLESGWIGRRGIRVGTETDKDVADLEFPIEVGRNLHADGHVVSQHDGQGGLADLGDLVHDGCNACREHDVVRSQYDTVRARIARRPRRDKNIERRRPGQRECLGADDPLSGDAAEDADAGVRQAHHARGRCIGGDLLKQRCAGGRGPRRCARFGPNSADAQVAEGEGEYLAADRELDKRTAWADTGCTTQDQTDSQGRQKHTTTSDSCGHEEASFRVRVQRESRDSPSDIHRYPA
jgi:hypothetical protein